MFVEKSVVDKDIENIMKMSPYKDSDLKKKLKTEDFHKAECENKNIENRIKISQDEDNPTNKLDSENAYEVKCNAENIENVIKTPENKNSDAKKMSKKKYIRKIEYEDEDIEDHCSEATYLARQMTSAERLYPSESTQLYNLHVQLRRAVLPQHQIETRAGSHMPTRREMEEFEEIIPIRKGSYSFEEDKIIVHNWKKFCKMHDWDVKKTQPFLQLRIGRLTYMRNTTERRKFVQFLADGLPDRTLYSVYHRFKNLYKDNVQRRYKPDEDQMIIDHLEHNSSLDESRKYTDLAKVLRRTRHSIWRRYRILKRKSKLLKDECD